MNSEALAKKVESELDRWSREDEKRAEGLRTSCCPESMIRQQRAQARWERAPAGQPGVKRSQTTRHSSGSRPSTGGTRGGAAYHYNFWWVVGHQMMHPCRDERARGEAVRQAPRGLGRNVTLRESSSQAPGSRKEMILCVYISFRICTRNSATGPIPTTPADVVVLAGDTGIHTSGLRWASAHFAGRTVVYVAGQPRVLRRVVAEPDPGPAKRCAEAGRALS